MLPGRASKLGGDFSAEPSSVEYDPEPRPSIGDRSYLILEYLARVTKVIERLALMNNLLSIANRD